MVYKTIRDKIFDGVIKKMWDDHIMPTYKGQIISLKQDNITNQIPRMKRQWM